MSNPIVLFKGVLSEFNNDSKWDDANFSKIKVISNTKVGDVGQLFIERFCGELSIPCIFPVNAQGQRLKQNPWDIKIGDIEFELKTATEDTTGNFQFNHIRYHRPYQALMCLGVSPNNLYFGLWSKAEVVTGKAGNLVTMEKSANASFKLTKSPRTLFEISQFQTKLEEFQRTFQR